MEKLLDDLREKQKQAKLLFENLKNSKFYESNIAEMCNNVYEDFGENNIILFFPGDLKDRYEMALELGEMVFEKGDDAIKNFSQRITKCKDGKTFDIYNDLNNQLNFVREISEEVIQAIFEVETHIEDLIFDIENSTKEGEFNDEQKRVGAELIEKLKEATYHYKVQKSSRSWKVTDSGFRSDAHVMAIRMYKKIDELEDVFSATAC